MDLYQDYSNFVPEVHRSANVVGTCFTKVNILGKKSPAHLRYLSYKIKTIMLMDMFYISQETTNYTE